jgi:hypothetical protein
MHLTAAFRLCSPLNNNDDVDTLAEWIKSGFDFLAMGKCFMLLVLLLVLLVELLGVLLVVLIVIGGVSGVIGSVIGGVIGDVIGDVSVLVCYCWCVIGGVCWCWCVYVGVLLLVCNWQCHWG